MTNKQRFPYAYKKIVRKHKDLKVRKTSIQENLIVLSYYLGDKMLQDCTCGKRQYLNFISG